MAPQRCISFGTANRSRDFDLVDSPDLVVVRTRNRAAPESFWHTLPGVAPLLPALQRQDAFPESGVFIFRILPPPGYTGATFRDHLKAVVRAANDPRIEYIGTVLMFADTGIYQIYTGNLFLKFYAGVSDAAMARILLGQHLSVKQPLSFAVNAYFLEAADTVGKDIFDRARELRQLPEVEYAHPETVVRRKSIQDDPALPVDALLTLSRDWVLQQVRVPAAWKHTRGRGVCIAVIDDGLEFEHPAFNTPGKIAAYRDMHDRGTNRRPVHLFDERHGTACASIACSADPQAPGVAPEAQLMPIRSMGLGSVLESEAFQWAADKGADIISCSWGPPDGHPLDPSDDKRPYPIPDHTNLAIRYAATRGRRGKGCAVFFAAGNGNEPVAYDEYASHPLVMAVGATNRNNTKALYSDVQHPLFCCFPSGDYQNVEGRLKQLYGVAVADRIGGPGYTAGDYYNHFAGTSASCPGLAGVAALMLSLAPDLHRDELKNLLARSCLRVGDASAYNAQGISDAYGYGLIQADLAVRNTLHFLQTPKPNAMIPATASGKRISLHIGINTVDPDFYKSLIPPLYGCIGDMQKMETLARGNGFTTQTLTDAEATRDAIRTFLSNQAEDLKEGDMLLLSYAGHGASLPNGGSEEIDGYDEAWVTYDGFLTDDELFRHLALFHEGVRVLLISDSCHSGTQLRNVNALPQTTETQRPRFVPPDVVEKVLQANNMSARALRVGFARSRSELEHQAAILLMAACQDHQFAMETNAGGVFTVKLLEMLKADADGLSYRDCIDALKRRMPSSQQPNLDTLGKNTLPFESEPMFRPGHASAEKPQKKPAKVKRADVVNLVVDTDKRVLRPEPPAGARGAAVPEFPVINQVVDGTQLSGRTPWDKAHEFLNTFSDDELFDVEPDMPSDLYVEPSTDPEALQGRSVEGYIPTYPNPEDPSNPVVAPFIWHLDNDHSQLLAANEMVFPEIGLGDQANDPDNLVKIAHIDTGFYPQSPTLPLYLDADADVRFRINGDAVEGAEDADQQFAVAEQEGHGNATLSILAGRRVSKAVTNGAYEGVFGAIPFARVLPLKISETVAIVSGKKFKSAVEYAIKNNVNVISMSMAGWPSKAMADAVNKAYEAGIVLVSAASNCFAKGFGRALPPTMLYPARFDRTIGVVGAMVDHKPYLVRFGKTARAEGGEYMQMCYGPKEAMKTAIAGYTPNISWFNRDAVKAAREGRFFVKSGGGTSSATPQVAAAAALYIQKHKALFDALPPGQRWKIVEVVKKALFTTAHKDPQYEEFFGNGVLRAKNALVHADAQKLLNELKDEHKAPAAKANSFFATLFSLYKRSTVPQSTREKLVHEMMQTELLQLLHRDERLYPFLQYDLGGASGTLSDEEKQNLIAAVLQSDLASDALKRHLTLFMPSSDRSALRMAGGGELPMYGARVEGEGCTVHFRSENLVFETVHVNKGLYVDDASGYTVDEIVLEISSMGARGGEMAFDLVTDLDERGRQGVVLSEFEEGGETLYRWNFEEASREPGTARSLRLASTPGAGTFSIGLTAFQQSRSRGGGFKPGRLVVKLFSWLKPKSKKPTDVLASVGDRKYGLYFYDLKRKSDEKGRAWVPVESKPEYWDTIKTSDKPLLVLFPGTFSKIEKGFDELLCENERVNALAGAHCQYALGFNMPTAADGVKDNVVWLDTALKGILKNKTCRVLARSRGGLVARYAFEKHWNGNPEAPLVLDRLVMTATPNQGTHLVDADHWKDMINIVTNLLGKAFLPSSPAFDTVGVVLKAIVNGVLKLPGLDDQQIGGPFLTDLNKDLPAGSLKNYFVATSNYEPGRVLAAFFDQILYDEKIFRDALNDKVVPVDSARMQLAHAEGLGALPQENVLPCGQSERINHFAYLRSKHKISVEWVVEKLTKG